MDAEKIKTAETGRWENREWDVAVAGAGPAGATAAALLAAKGRRVLLLDKAGAPRKKVCGDGLVSDAIRCVRQLGLLPEVVRAGHFIDKVTMVSPSRNFTTAKGVFLTCRREILDTLIVKKAVENGAIFARAQVKDIVTNAEGRACLRIQGQNEPVKARVVLAATGANLKIIRSLCPDLSLRPGAVAARLYVRSDVEMDRMVICEDRSVLPGYGWIFPMGKGEYNIGAGYFSGPDKKQPRLRDLFHGFVTRFPDARRIMDKARDVSELQAGILRCGLQGAPPLIGKNLLVLGESMGATYATIGEGIGTAMQSGEFAARAANAFLDSGALRDLSLYPSLVEAYLGPRHKAWNLAHRALAKAWINDMFVYRVERDPHMKLAMERVLNQTMDPMGVLWFKGFVLDWLSWPKRAMAQLLEERRKRYR